jgi:hypothetical protein
MFYHSPIKDIDVVIVQNNRPVWLSDANMGDITTSDAKEVVKTVIRVAPKTDIVIFIERLSSVADMSLERQELDLKLQPLRSGIFQERAGL